MDLGSQITKGGGGWGGLGGLQSRKAGWTDGHMEIWKPADLRKPSACRNVNKLCIRVLPLCSEWTFVPQRLFLPMNTVANQRKVSILFEWHSGKTEGKLRASIGFTSNFMLLPVMETDEMDTWGQAPTAVYIKVVMVPKRAEMWESLVYSSWAQFETEPFRATAAF